jgi:hypothetical protein
MRRPARVHLAKTLSRPSISGNRDLAVVGLLVRCWAVNAQLSQYLDGIGE